MKPATPKLLAKAVPTMLCVALLAMTSCQPQDVRPGTWVRGEPTEERVVDWAFTNEIEEIFIETRPWYGIPHSTTIWCVELDRRLYIGSYGYPVTRDNDEDGKDEDAIEEEKKAWEKNVARHPDAKLAIDGKIYPVTVTPVSDRDLMAALDAAYAAKYDMADVFGEELPEWWYYRVSQIGAIADDG